ncbi:hypothetical protein ABBQ38_012469 [Trebouxia sp. C0009 RCD-2024]
MHEQLESSSCIRAAAGLEVDAQHAQQAAAGVDADAQHAQQDAAGLDTKAQHSQQDAAGVDADAQHAQQDAAVLDAKAQHAQQAAAGLGANAQHAQQAAAGSSLMLSMHSRLLVKILQPDLQVKEQQACEAHRLKHRATVTDADDLPPTSAADEPAGPCSSLRADKLTTQDTSVVAGPQYA